MRLDRRDFARALARALAQDLEDPGTDEAVNAIIRRSSDPSRAIRNFILNDLRRGFRNESPVFFPQTRRLIRDMIRTDAAMTASGLGAILGLDAGEIVSGLIGAATAVYAAKLQAKTQEKLLKLKLAEQRRQEEIARQRMEALARARAQPIRAATAPEPWYKSPWIWVAGGAALLGIGYLAFRPRSNPSPRRRFRWPLTLETTAKIGLAATMIGLELKKRKDHAGLTKRS